MPAISRIWARSALISAGLQPQQENWNPGDWSAQLAYSSRSAARDGRPTPRLQGNSSRRNRSYGHSMGVNTPARKSALVCGAGGRLGGRLDQLHQHAAGVLGVHEVDPRARRTALGGVVEQSDAGRAQLGAGRVHVVHAVGHLLDALAVAGQELADRGVWAQRGQQLDAGAGVADSEHGLAHALLLVGLDVHGLKAELLLVERDGRIQVLDGDPHMVDASEHGLLLVGRVGSDRMPQTSAQGLLFPSYRPPVS